MTSHWSENDSIDLLRICINNYPKFFHLKNNNESDKFFDERCFSRYHNLGKNGKNIKNRIENIQKKFRKNIRSIDIDKLRDGLIDEEIYKNDESKDLFNTSFEFERLYGKHFGSKELMKIIDEVCHSDYWITNRRNIHPRWRKRTTDSQGSVEEIVTPKKSCLAKTSNQIIISSTETSPSQSDDLAQFKDVDYIDNPEKSKNVKSKKFYNSKGGSRNIRLRSSSLSPNSTNIGYKNGGINAITQTDKLLRNIDVMSVMTETDITLTMSKETITDIPTPSRLQVCHVHLDDIPPLGVDALTAISSTITSTFGPIVSDISSIKETLMEISKSIRDVVQVMMTSKADIR